MALTLPHRLAFRTTIVTWRHRLRRLNCEVLQMCLMLLIHNVYVIESFYRDYRSVNNRLIRLHQTFREELADQLVGVFRSERKHAGRPSDMYVTEARLQNVGLHHPSVDVCKDCALCA